MRQLGRARRQADAGGLRRRRPYGRRHLPAGAPRSGSSCYSSTGGGVVVQWVLSTYMPLAADFDGDGRADLAVYRPSNGQWFLKLSTATFGATILRSWGLAGDVPLVGRLRRRWPQRDRGLPSVHGPVARASIRLRPHPWSACRSGLPGDVPAPHDFDGDGRADLAVFRPSIGQWFIRRSTNGTLLNVPWGLAGRHPALERRGTRATAEAGWQLPALDLCANALEQAFEKVTA